MTFPLIEIAHFKKKKRKLNIINYNTFHKVGSWSDPIILDKRDKSSEKMRRIFQFTLYIIKLNVETEPCKDKYNWGDVK